jgi:hypothetical protein
MGFHVYSSVAEVKVLVTDVSVFAMFHCCSGYLEAAAPA